MFWYISNIFDLYGKNQLFTNYDHFKLEKRKASNLENKAPIVKSEKVKKQRNHFDSPKKDAAKAKTQSKIESLEQELMEIDVAMSA